MRYERTRSRLERLRVLYCLSARPLAYLGQMTTFISRVRLTYYYPVLFAAFLTIILNVHKIAMTGGPLTLFSVNSFLLAFYLGPIMSGQKQRIDDLSRTVRAEAIALLNLTVHDRELSAMHRAEIRKLIRQYVAASAHVQKPDAGEREYERLIAYCLEVEGRDEGNAQKVIDTLITNQQNRGQISTLLRGQVYSHEWVVLIALFSITISYIVLIDYGGSLLLNVVAALLCAGLTLLFMILQKLNSLTHKRAKEIWTPFDKLLSSNLSQID